MKTEFYIQLFNRDIARLNAELEMYPDDESLWLVLPGTMNSGGNLIQHLIGNLKTFVGNPFGHINYERNRDAEFNARLFTKDELVKELNQLAAIITASLSALTEAKLAEEYPAEIKVVQEEQTIEYVLVHLFAHLSYHTGQLNYHRRYVTSK
ncbi:DinB family protein [Pedobacter cryoconitis]|uniref:DinB superfamily protein n=1 Tax=Pedobacter cryoconitis TaxID=188932 RepID=A0A7X0J6R6_9SPHI|nr:DUF1572 family protein [Pedobacter cryoconitis]MBB6501983.1 hypothetical protein [Pedobacter cryoconitis]